MSLPNSHVFNLEKDSTKIIGEIVNSSYLVGYEKPVPGLVINHGNFEKLCEDFKIEFDASGSYDFCDDVDELLVRFDFEGDGIWDTDFQYNRILNHIFLLPGFYIPAIQVKNTKGLCSFYHGELKIEGREGRWGDEFDEPTYYCGTW